MGYSASNLLGPRIVTKKDVHQLLGNTVWLVSGEGSRSPKVFYLGAVFKVNRVESCYEHPDFKNSAHGMGHIYGESLLLSGNEWFEKFKVNQSNFRNSLTEIRVCQWLQISWRSQVTSPNTTPNTTAG
jgi:hypothetical protein